MIVKHYRDFIYGGFFLWILGLFSYGTKSVLHAFMLPTACVIFYLGAILWLISERKNEDDPNTIGGIIHMTIDQFSYLFGITKYAIVAILLFVIPLSSIKVIPVIKEKIEWDQTIQKLDNNSELDEIFGQHRVYTYPNWIDIKPEHRTAKTHTKGDKSIGSFTYTIEPDGKITDITVNQHEVIE